MIQCGDCPGFPFEAFAEVGRGDFDGHIAPQARIVGAIHFAHASLADLLGNFIRPEFVPARKWHQI
jgi:hypothetical protein